MIYHYNDKPFPEYLKEGNAINYILPFAKYFMKGSVLDIGGTKKWHYPDAEYVNVENNDGFHAMQLPNKRYDSIISSHTLEHLKDPYYALAEWHTHLKKGGCLFLYLPHVHMDYWAFDNPRHLHILTPEIIKGWMTKLGYKDIITSGQDLYFSFSVIGFKK
jgi:SAM-dependent methyltransferase